MSAASRSAIKAKSKDLEDKSGIQLVVATVKSLQGSDIENYANQLFRFWKLGEAKKSNGVFLLVAPAEHNVRIEVGYGLEGTLTDALSSVIISSAIVPRFKANDYSGGIERGVDAIISVLTTDASAWQQKVINVRSEDQSSAFNKLFSILLVVFVIIILRLIYDPPSFRSRLISTPNGGSWGGGGFSGGGGSPGGGVRPTAGDFPEAAVRLAAVARREAGDGVDQRGSRGHQGSALIFAERRLSCRVYQSRVTLTLTLPSKVNFGYTLGIVASLAC